MPDDDHPPRRDDDPTSLASVAALRCERCGYETDDLRLFHIHRWGILSVCLQRRVKRWLP